jgi:Mrp family chromosome partitioning ATPase
MVGSVTTPRQATRPDRSGRSPVVALLRRRWLFILGTALIGGTLVGAAVTVRPVTYSSTATVLVTQTGVDESAAPANGQGRKVGVNLDTEAQLVKSVQVTERAKALLETDWTRDALTAGAKVEVPANTSLLTITYRAKTAAEAQRGAQAFATAYLDNRHAVAAANLASQIKSVQQQLASLRAQLRVTAKKMSVTPFRSAGRAFIQAQADVLTSQVAALSDRLSTLQSTAITPGRIIVNAPVSPAPDGPSTAMLLAGAGLVGLLGVLALAVVRDRTDPRLHTASETERRTGAPVLLDLASEPALRSSPGAAQELQRLQNTLTASLPDAGRVILVTAATDGSAAGPVAANVAAALAHGGSTAILLCADPASRTGAELVGDGAGLAEVLTGELPISDALRPVPAVEALRIATPGADPVRLSAQLHGPAAGRLVAAARALADYVVIETAPAVTSADAQTIARRADAGIVVVESGRSRLIEVRAALQQLADVRLEHAGCALVPAARSRQVTLATVLPPGHEPETPALAHPATAPEAAYSTGPRRSPGRRRTPPPVARPAGRARRAR